MKLVRDDLENVADELERCCFGIQKGSPCSIFIPFEDKGENIETNQFNMLLNEESAEGYAKVIKSGVIISSEGILIGYVENPITEISLMDYVHTLRQNTADYSYLENLEGFLIRNSSILIYNKIRDNIN